MKQSEILEDYERLVEVYRERAAYWIGVGDDIKLSNDTPIEIAEGGAWITARHFIYGDNL